MYNGSTERDTFSKLEKATLQRWVGVIRQRRSKHTFSRLRNYGSVRYEAREIGRDLVLLC